MDEQVFPPHRRPVHPPSSRLRSHVFSGDVPGKLFAQAINRRTFLKISGASAVAATFTWLPKGLVRVASANPATADQISIYAYIPNEADGTVSVVNTSTDTVLTTITVGSSPVAAAVMPDASKVYIVHENSSGTVSVIDTSTNTVSSTITVGKDPLGIAITPDGKKAYVANSASSTVSVIDTTTDTVSATLSSSISDPWGVAITPDGTKAYVSNTGASTVSVIDIATDSILTGTRYPIQLGRQSPNCMAITPDGTKLYVADNLDVNPPTISVIDVWNDAVTTTIYFPSGWGADSIAFTPDSKKAYVCNGSFNVVSVINVATDSIITGTGYPISPVVGPSGVAVTPDGTKAYVLDSDVLGYITVIDTSTDTIATTVSVGEVPESAGMFIQQSYFVSSPSMGISTNWFGC